MIILSLSTPILAIGRARLEFEIPFNAKIKYAGDPNVLPSQYQFEPRAGVKIGRYFQTGLTYLGEANQTEGRNYIGTDAGADTSTAGRIPSLYKKNTYKNGFGFYLQVNLPNQVFFKGIYPFLGAELAGQIAESDILIYNADLQRFEKSSAPNSNAVLHEGRLSTYIGFRNDFNEYLGLYGALTQDFTRYNLIGSYRSTTSSIGAKWGLAITI